MYINKPTTGVYGQTNSNTQVLTHCTTKHTVCLLSEIYVSQLGKDGMKHNAI